MDSRREQLFALARATKGFMPDVEGEALSGAALDAGRAFAGATFGASALLRKLVADGKLNELHLIGQGSRRLRGGIFRSGHKQRF